MPPLHPPPHCRGPRCGPGPSIAHGRFGRRPGVFGPGVAGNRPIVPPPIAGHVPPHGVPISPPPAAGPVMPPPIVGHAPAPIANPSYPTGAGGYVADRRTHAPAMAPTDPLADPMSGYGGADPSGEVAWTYADDGYAYADPSSVESGSPAWDLWQDLYGSYLETRNAAVSATGESFPDTTTGDVRKASLVLSRELCLPRYDFADLVATRAAWRDALARIHTLCASVPWSAPYPENERFWLSDSFALAQRLAAIDERRNAIVGTIGGVLTILGDRSDPVETWQDVRAFYLARRLVKTDDRGWRYPETSVEDAHSLVHVLNTDVSETVAALPSGSPIQTWVLGHVRRWRPIAEAVKAHARENDGDAPYPDNARLWHAAKRIAIALSSARNVAGLRVSDFVRETFADEETST
jgi:hypothetical protein